MIAFVTLAEAKDQLYVLDDETHDDALINGLISAASVAVRRYLKDTPPWAAVLDSNLLPEIDSNGSIVYETDSNGDKVVDPVVKQATLLLIGMLYKDREGEAGIINPQWQHGFMPAVVTALLYPLRVPTVA